MTATVTALPTAQPTMRETFYRVVEELLDGDHRVAVVLADISAAALARVRDKHPDRLLNVGIREQLMVGVAAGLAAEGLRPIVHSYAPFLLARPYEQLKLDLGHQGFPAVLVSIGASYDVASAGRTHHAPEDVALLDTLPGWTVHVPGHPEEVDRLLRRAVRAGGNVYLRLSEQANAVARPVDDATMRVVRRGSRGSVVAVGPMLDRVLVATQGLDVTVLYAATVRPFDADTLRRTLGAPLVAVVEPYLAGTSAAAVSAALRDVPYRLLTLGVPNVELRRYGSAADHDRAYGLDVPGLRASLSAFFGTP